MKPKTLPWYTYLEVFAIPTAWELCNRGGGGVVGFINNKELTEHLRMVGRKRSVKFRNGYWYVWTSDVTWARKIADPSIIQAMRAEKAKRGKKKAKDITRSEKYEEQLKKVTR